MGPGALAARLALGKPMASEVDRSGGFHGAASARLAALVDAGAVQPLLPALEARRMSPPSQYAVLAARAALAEARLAVRDEPDGSLAVVAATAFGPASWTQKMFDQVLDEGPRAASPALFSECVANAATARAALACRAAGVNLTLAQGEAGPLRALGRGAALAASGRARAVLAGAADEMPPLVHAILDRFRALARPGPGRSESARPFAQDRDGFLAAEGATFLLLEDEGAAAERGAVPLARIRAHGAAFDPTAPVGRWGTGAAGIAASLAGGLARHGLAPGDIDAIVSGASGSIEGDRLEARVLEAAWSGARLPAILVPKAVTGEYGGAFLAAAVLLLTGLAPPDALVLRDPAPGLGLRPRRLDGGRVLRRMLAITLAAGGPASWVVLEKP
jgi:3-oxoacyl-[acyl-carrier-protein] synthase II